MGKAADAALALAGVFFKSIPATKKRRMTEMEWVSALDKFHSAARDIRKQYALGVVARAVTAYYFQRRLLQAGLDTDTVRKLLLSLVLHFFVCGQ